MRYFKLFILSFMAVYTLTSCHRQTTDMADREGGDASFYDQGNTSACWIYAMCVCIEHEQQLKGDSIALSRQWLIAKALEEQTLWLYHLNENENEDEDNNESFSMRGVGPEALRLISRYGLVPYTHERTHINSSNVAIRKLTFFAQHARSLTSLEDSMEDILPQFTLSHGGEGAFYYLSMRYTPQQFAESIMYDQQWEFYASVDYHAWGEKFALEIPDNPRRHEYTNVPMDDMVRRVVSSLQHGHAVYWEYGKNRRSDHAMAIVGITKDTNGSTLLICRNSYGRDWGKNGMCSVTLDFFRKHTCNVGIVNGNKE